jgi:hypothetical protein
MENNKRFGYIYCQVGHSRTKKTIRVRPSSSSSFVSPALTDLEVGAHDEWQSFQDWKKEWICSLPPTALTQQEWWAANGLAFRLLDLPAELRLAIYEQAIGPCIRIGFLDDQHPEVNTFKEPVVCRITKFPVKSHFGQKILKNRSRMLRSGDVAALACTSKQVSMEVQKATWEGTTKQFIFSRYLADFVAYPQARIAWNALRRIELDLTNTGYFKYLGLKSSHHVGFEDDQDQDGATITRLKDLPSLFHLHFHFDVRRPAQSESGRTLFSDDPRRTIRSPHGTSKVSCQKKIVDWFFILAWSDIRHIPRMTFSGHVKNSTCVEWEVKFKASSKEKAKRDFPKTIANIQAAPWQSL